MDVHSETLTIDHVIQDLSSLKQMGCQVVLIEVLDREMNCVDSNFIVVVHHNVLFDTSETHVTMSLNVEHSSYSGLMQKIYIFLRLRIGT